MAVAVHHGWQSRHREQGGGCHGRQRCGWWVVVVVVVAAAGVVDRLLEI